MDSRPSTILFDLDGTLCRYDRPGSAVLSAAFDRLGIDPCFSMHQFHDRYVELLPDCADGFELYERTFAALLEDHGGDPDLAADLTRAFYDERDPGDLEAIEGAESVLPSLATEYRLGLVTNGHPELQRRKLCAIGLSDAFETVVFAGYETAPKPDPEPFDRALSAIDATPDEAVYVGNRPAIDVAGARAAGVRAAWLATGDRRPEPRPDYVLESIRDLERPPW